MSISLICIALLALLVMTLALVIFIVRFKKNVMFGHSVDPEDGLFKSIRAHGNAIEYIPIIALIIYILGTMPLSGWVVLCMILFTLFRYMAAAGLLFPQSMGKPNPLRLIGALGTYATGFGLCIALLMKALIAL